jgi:C-terminal processing protease CtpA/Prc
MTPRKRLALAVVLVLVIGASIILLLHQPQKPVRRRQPPPPAEVVGVGIALRINTRTHELLVQDIVPNTPAAEAGITNGLIINKVDDEQMIGKPLAECANLIRGAAGSTVRLELVTSDHSQTNVVELTRRKITLKALPSVPQEPSR